MNVRLTGRERGRSSLGHGSPMWAMLSLVVVLATSVRASDQGDTPNASIKGDKLVDVKTAGGPPPRVADDRVASADVAPRTHIVKKPVVVATTDRAAVAVSEAPPIERAIRLIAECQSRYNAIDDYTCTFYKRERIEGKTTPQYIMAMKVRTKPQSIYFKFQRPAQGREAIYIAGRHDGKVLAHAVGINKFLAGTLHLEPTSSMAMEDCRHPITEAGIGPLLDTLAKRWAVELSADESIMTFSDMMIGTSRCTLIESTHPKRLPAFLHYKVRVYIDQDLGLPIRFEAYDWPKHHKSDPELVEEYTYMHLKLNVGLRDIDFDISNAAYSFGRF